MENLSINKCWMSSEKSENPGAITWMKMEITPEGEIVSQEFLVHVKVNEPDYTTVLAWLKAIGRL